MPNTIHQDLKNLSNQCFLVEAKLPKFSITEANTDAQYIRRELYRLRCMMGDIQTFVDKWKVEYDE